MALPRLLTLVLTIVLAGTFVSADTVSNWTQLEHKYAQVEENIKLQYVEFGPSDGMPVVLVHGWPDVGFGWRHQIGELSKKFRVIVPDLRGFGGSSNPKEPEKYGSKIITDDLAHFLDFLNIPKAVFIGHDWGGIMIWRMALYHPTRVIAVGSVCSPYLPPSSQFVDYDTLIKKFPQFSYQQYLSTGDPAAKLLDQAPSRVFTALFRNHLEQGPTFDVRVVLENLLTSDSSIYTELSDVLTEAELAFYVQQYTASGFRSNINFYNTRALDFQNERGLPLQIPHKSLFIGAKDDPVLKPELSAGMPQLMPRLEMTFVENAGHWILWEKAEEVTGLLSNWLSNVQQEEFQL